MQTSTASADSVEATVVMPESKVPSPSCPLPLLPQQRTPPARRTAQLEFPPDAICRTGPRPETATGVDRSSIEPSPSCASRLYPQHRTDPSLRRAQKWLNPALISTTSARPGTAPAVPRGEVLLPSPSCPRLLSPQQRTLPSVVQTQVVPPVATMPTALATAGTTVGVATTAVPSPWPA